MPAEHTQSFATMLVIVVATAAIIATLLKRLRLDTIPGYLLAGAIIGPHALALVKDSAGVADLSHLATILLLFTIGLHMDLSAMRRGMVHIAAIGLISTLAGTLLLWGASVLLGLSAPAGLVVALALSLSSTAVLVRTLMERRETHTQHGRITLGVSIVQDLASVVALAAFPAIAIWAGFEAAASTGIAASETNPTMDTAFGAALSVLRHIWQQPVLRAVLASVGVFVMLISGRLLLPRILSFVARTGSRELVLVASAAIALVGAAWTSFVGFSPEMGAFIAGFLLSVTPFRHQLSGQFAPLRDLMMAVFFTTVGLRVDPAWVLHNLPLVLGAAALTIIAKGIAIGVCTYLAGATAATATITGLYLANGGEFTLVVLGAGGAIVPSEAQSAVISVVIVTLMAAPFLVRPAHALAHRARSWPLSPILSRWVATGLRERAEQAAQVTAQSAAGDGDAGEGPAHSETGSADAAGAGTPSPALRRVIIAGFGPVGRAIADRMRARGVACTIIELNAKTVHRQSELGRAIVYGDISNPDVLEEAGVREADAVFLTVPDDDAVLHACQCVRAAAPRVFIAARMKFLSGKVQALKLGANVVTVEEVATAQALEQEALAALPAEPRPA